MFAIVGAPIKMIKPKQIFFESRYLMWARPNSLFLNVINKLQLNIHSYIIINNFIWFHTISVQKGARSADKFSNIPKMNVISLNVLCSYQNVQTKLNYPNPGHAKKNVMKSAARQSASKLWYKSLKPFFFVSCLFT